MRRYVILSHDHPFPHWDLMLEAGGALRTWRLHAAPAADIDVRAESLGDHRVDYLDYEGPVSGGRGTVTRWDGGVFEWLEDRDGATRILVRGRRLSGEIDLVRTGSGAWQCRFEPAQG